MSRAWRQLFRRVGLMTVGLFAATEAAQAHIVGARLGDFYAGALHPLTDLQDLILWIALGLLAASVGAARGRWLMLMLPLGLSGGLTLGWAFGIDPVGPVVNAGMLVALGLLLASGQRIGGASLCAIAFAFAALRGVVNGEGVEPQTDRLLFAAGLASAGYVAITLITASALAFRGPEHAPVPPWRHIAVRACGSWIAAIGLMMGGFALAS